MKKNLNFHSILLPVLLLSIFQCETFGQSKSFFSLEVESFLSNRIDLSVSNIDQIDLMGSSLVAQRNFGQYYKFRKYNFLKERYGFYYGLAGGFSLIGFDYVSTFEFNEGNFGPDNPFNNSVNKISIAAIELVSAQIGGIYNFKLSENSNISLSIGASIFYAFRRSNSLTSSRLQDTGNSTTVFSARLIINDRNKIQFYSDYEIGLYHFFGKSKFGFKVGLGGSYLLTKPYIEGDVFLFGTTENVEVDLSSKFYWNGITLGLLYRLFKS